MLDRLSCTNADIFCVSEVLTDGSKSFLDFYVKIFCDTIENN